MFDNKIVGDRLNDNLLGTEEADRLLGIIGNDFIVGKQGNDILLGGLGEDTLNGTNPNSPHPGRGEIDTLKGAKDADLFVLGDAANIYYSGSQANDYALITDFDASDTIQLKGTATDYVLRENIEVQGYSGTAIVTADEELIGFISNSQNLSLDSDRFSYIDLPDFDKMYVFSDSLSDPGNIFKATKSVQLFDIFGTDIPVTPSSPPYYQGRFSNGFVWVERLATELEIDLIPSTDLSVIFPGLNINSPFNFSFSDGFGLIVNSDFNGRTTEESVNFAFGGAQTGEVGSGEFGDLIPGIKQQVEWFVEDHREADKTADADALYIISGGRNDYSDDDPNPEDIINNIESEIESLYEIGARDFLVSNLPDLGKIPATPAELTDTFSGYTQTHNELLEQTTEELRDELTGANIVILNFNTLFDEILENPQDYDLTNVSDPYLDPISLEPTVGASVDEYLFYDTVHPTATVHDIVNDFTLNTLATEFATV